MNSHFFNAIHLPTCPNLSRAVALICLLPGIASAQVTGVWETTGLTRVDITPIKAPLLRPEHTVDIADSTYNFNADSSFLSYQISGSWKQKPNKNQYIITANKSALENLFRKSLEDSQTVFVNQLKLVKSTLTGLELDNGIWGNERYEYKLDVTNKATSRREVIRFVMTVQVAGMRPTAGAAKTPLKAVKSAPSSHSPMDAAVAAVLNHLNRQ
ncbi:MAG: hypothetical protein ABL925_09305 [Methylococcales bacterium]